MLQFKNATPFVGTIFLMPDTDGIDSLFTVVKGTFALDANLAVAAEQIPVALEEQYYGEPGSSSIRVPSDIGLAKPGTDVLLVGHAYAPGGRPVAGMDVAVTVGQVRKTVRVTGNRVWRADAAGAVMSPPELFTRMPLVWERAYGGADLTRKGTLEHSGNPVGAGYRTGDSERPLDGLRLPNLEDPSVPIAGWKDAPPPACLAPVSAHWEPRRSFAGTYDERWQKERAPFLPADFDSRFFQLAPQGLVAPRYMQGGEPVEVRGATPSGVLRFQLPSVRIQATYLLDGAPQVRPANLDTVLIEPDRSHLILVWRAVLPCDKRALRVSEVRAELARAA